ncbi:MAG: hypothetical protein AB7N65_27070, partial [Vicinamibacterales bacterium]
MPAQATTISAKRRRSRKSIAVEVPARRASLTAGRAITLPLSAAVLVAAATLLPGFPSAPASRWGCLGAAAVLLLGSVALLIDAARRHRTFSIEVSLRKQHYIQACAHLTIYWYWANYWQGVPDAAPLIAAQLAFAYGVDTLLSWSRRESYTLGFGPFPIIFSTNLFLWFKPEW